MVKHAIKTRTGTMILNNTVNYRSFKKITVLCLFIILSLLLTFNNSINVLALSAEQRNIYQKGINFYDIEDNICGKIDKSTAPTELAPGTGSPKGTTFPNLDPVAMGKAIDTYIKEKYPSSKMVGLGSTIVNGAENSNINPFLIVAIAQKESSLSNPSDYNVRNGSNSFGRTATKSQPHFTGSRTWYYWSSVKASVDHTAPENQKTKVGDIAAYLRNSGFYTKAINSNDLTKLMMTYAPPHENDTTGYVNEIKQTTDKLIQLTKQGSGDTSDTTDNEDDSSSASIDSNGCCQVPSIDDPSGNKEIIWNYLISELGFSNIQAAGILGNIEQESGFDPNSTNPDTGAYGIAQWLGGRKTNLEEFAAKQGRPVSDLQVQLLFMDQELSRSYKGAVTDPIKASSNLAEITRIFLEKYEVPCMPGSSDCDKEMNVRLPFAEKTLSGVDGLGSTGSVSASVCGSSSTVSVSGVEIKQLSPYLSSPGGKVKPKGITLHWWGNNGSGGIDSLSSYLKSNKSCGAGGCSVQLGITKEGEVYQMTKDLLDLTYHAKGANSTTIGIEIEGGPKDFGKEGIEKYPKKYIAVVATVKMLMEKYDIPIEGAISCDNISGIHSHKDLASCGNVGKIDIDDYYFNQVIKDVKASK